MISLRRSLRAVTLIAALGAGSAGLSGCDASPYAASVNGHIISVNSLNHQLSLWSANPGLVQSFNSAHSGVNGGNGVTVVGQGGAGTYSTAFADQVLTIIVQGEAVHQYVVARRMEATPDELVAARAADNVIFTTTSASGAVEQDWTKFSPSLREFLTRFLAEEAQFVQPPQDTSQLQSPFNQIQPFLFSQVCVKQASAFDAAAAQRIASSGVVNGPPVCLDQAAFESEPPVYQQALQLLASPGDISPAVHTSYGFVVLQLVSRTSPGFDAGVQRVIVAATSQSVPGLDSVLSAARVKVNPAYGTWVSPSVQPPHAPLSSPSPSP